MTDEELDRMIAEQRPTMPPYDNEPGWGGRRKPGIRTAKGRR
jgi:hypothetical protein